MEITCHLYTKAPLESSDLAISSAFTTLTVFLDESHDKKYLLACKSCGQLYYFDFHEELSMIDGEDPQLSVFVPIQNASQAEDLSKREQYELGAYIPRLIKDFPHDVDAPQIFWVRPN